MFIPSPKVLAVSVINQRKKLKLSQAEVGERVGLKQQTISAFESKPDRTRIDTLFRILSAVNLDMQLLAKDATESVKSEWKEGW